MLALTSAKKMMAVNMEARRHAIGAITKVAKWALNEGPSGPSLVDFESCCDRKYTREERTVRRMESRMP